jgi:hypothetical protein
MKFASIRKQVTKALRLLAPALLIGAMGSTALARGTDLSGGGTSVEVQTATGQLERVLLDFVNLGQPPATHTPGFKFERTRAYKKLGVEKLELSKTPFYSDLVNRFKLFEQKSPLFVKYLTQAARNVAIYYTPYRFTKVDPTTYFVDPSLKENLKPQPVALFTSGFGILVSVPGAEQFSYENQRGLFAHEVVRHLQLSYGFRMTDKTVQSVVNLLLNGDPSIAPSFDSEAYFGKEKWKDLVGSEEVSAEEPKFITVSRSANHLIAKYSGQEVEVEPAKIANSVQLHAVIHQLRSGLTAIYPAIAEKLEACRATNESGCFDEAAKDSNQLDLAVAHLRNLSLDTILSGFNAITDDLKDRTVLLKNARQLELQIECANTAFCDVGAFKSWEGNPIQSLLERGELVK